MNTAIKLKCPNCNHPILSDDINIHKMTAKCSKCACVFPFKTRLFNRYSVPLKTKSTKPPTGIGFYQKGKKLSLNYRWWNIRYLFWILLAGLWNIATVMWFMVTLANDAYFMAMLGTIYAIGGIALLYVSIAGFLNVTSIDVDDFQLVVRHSPIPWSPTPKLRCDEIEQLYCTLDIHRGRHYTRYSYQLHAILKKGKVKTGKHVCLLKGIESAEQAQYLERKIERFLKIKDRYVHGEYLR